MRRDQENGVELWNVLNEAWHLSFLLTEILQALIHNISV